MLRALLHAPFKGGCRRSRGGTEPPAAGAPAPRIPAGGGPRPAFSASPPATRGERCSLRSRVFCRLPRWGRRRGLGALDAPPRPRRRGAPCSLRSRCAPSPPRPLRPLPSGCWRALRDPPPPFGRVRAPAAAPIACASPAMKCLGSPKKTVTLRDSRSRPPRNPFFLGTLPATFHIGMKLLLLSSGALPP